MVIDRKLVTAMLVGTCVVLGTACGSSSSTSSSLDTDEVVEETVSASGAAKLDKIVDLGFKDYETVYAEELAEAEAEAERKAYDLEHITDAEYIENHGITTDQFKVEKVSEYNEDDGSYTSHFEVTYSDDDRDIVMTILQDGNGGATLVYSDGTDTGYELTYVEEVDGYIVGDILYDSNYSDVDPDEPHVHTFDWSYVYEPTCLTEGYGEYVCTQCGMVYSIGFLDKLDHVEEYETVSEGNCTIISLIRVTCSECGSWLYDIETTIPDAHEWDTREVSVYDAETGETEVKTIQYCIWCGATGDEVTE